MARFTSEGTLQVKGSDVVFHGKATQKGKPANHRIGPNLLNAFVRSELDGLPVRVTFEDGGPRRIDRLHPPEITPQAPAPTDPISPAPPTADSAEGRAPISKTSAQPPAQASSRASNPPTGGHRLATARSSPIPNAGDSFVPAYNFIPLIDRATLPAELADAHPATHGRDLPDRYSGTIAVTITTRTPLLLPDHSRATQATVDGVDVSALPTKRTSGGKPILDGSAIKGMLRSAYEAITASRFGVFGGHREPLAVRSKARADTYPALVTRLEGDRRELTVVEHLFPTAMTHPGKDVNQVWVPRSLGHLVGPDLKPHVPLDTPSIDAWIQLAWHETSRFYFWQVVSAVRTGVATLPAKPTGSLIKAQRHTYQGHTIAVRGRLHWTDAPFQRKHDERLVVTDVLHGAAGVDSRILHGIPLEDSGLTEWQAVIDSFRGVRGRGDGAAHVGDYARPLGLGDQERWRDLAVGRTLHVKLGEDDKDATVARSPRPALIGRDPFARSPRQLLAAEASGGGHLPSPAVESLSPAERVFGWTVPDRRETENTVGQGVPGHRGHLRVEGAAGDVKAPAFADNAVMALSTLNSPKPAQYRSYLRDRTGSTIGANGNRNQDELRADKGYLDGQRISGRKVYLYDARTVGSAEYWTPVPLARQQGGGGFRNEYPMGTPPEVNAGGVRRHREFLAPPGFKAKTVTYVSGWVPIGCTFATTITVDNLTATELGALLWLLSLPSSADSPEQPGHLRLGLGKPLGFGVVRAEFDPDRTSIRTGTAIADSYRVVGSTPPAVDADELTGLRDRYDTLMREHSELSVVRDAFLRAAWGERDHPVHSPRSRPEPQTESFTWWTGNENRGTHGNGRRLGLPLLASDDRSVPYDATVAAPPVGQGHAGPNGQRQGRGRR